MNIVTWGPQYSVGVGKFDKQHQVLFDIINELFSAMSEGKGQTELAEVLNRLINYTKTHFAAEELLMQTYQYPEYPGHLVQHQELTNQVLDFQQQYQEGKIGLSLPMIQFLKSWLTNHILVEDKKYSSFFESKGIQ